MADNIQIKDASAVTRTMRTSDDAGVHTPQHIVAGMVGYDSTDAKLMVGNERSGFRDEFFSYDTVAKWQTVQTGSGMTVSTAGVSSGSRYLNIETGTTINAETIILSRESFRLPAKLSVALTLSQRIANQEVFLELVGVDAADIVETDGTFPSVETNDATNLAGLKFDGTLNGRVKYTVRGQGTDDIQSAVVIFSTTAATGTSPNFLPGALFEINADSEQVVFASKLIDSPAVIPENYKRNQRIPDSGKRYKIRIRVKNLGTAPASTTSVRLHAVRLLDTTRLTVDMARHMGRGGDVADSLSVYVAGAVTTTARFENGGSLSSSANGALAKARVMAAASTNATSVKATAGRLYEMHLCNLATTVRFVKLYNKASAPTVGTDVPVATYPIAPNGGRIDFMSLAGNSFSTGIAYAITGAVGDADTTAVAANDVVGELLYA